MTSVELGSSSAEIGLREKLIIALTLRVGPMLAA